MDLFEDWPDEVMRAKGLVSFVDDHPAMVSVVRDHLEMQSLASEDGSTMIELDDDGMVIELIFIGQGLHVETIRERLDACLAED
jgi:G3E family GTPase